MELKNTEISNIVVRALPGRDVVTSFMEALNLCVKERAQVQLMFNSEIWTIDPDKAKKTVFSFMDACKEPENITT